MQFRQSGVRAYREAAGQLHRGTYTQKSVPCTDWLCGNACQDVADKKKGYHIEQRVCNGLLREAVA